MKDLRVSYVLIALMLLSQSCSVMEQASEVVQFSRCEFRLFSVDNVELAGIDIEKVRSYKDLGLMDITRLSAAVAAGDLPLEFDLNIQARNPNNKLAAMNKLEWILYIDDIEMTRGLLDDRIEIQPGGDITTFPVFISIDLMEALSGESSEALLNFGFNLAGNGDRPTRILLKAKPSIMVGNTPVRYPGYINIRQEFTSN